MNRWPKLLLRITNTYLLWFNTRPQWHISVPSIKIWLFSVLLKIFARLRMNLVKVIFHKVVNQQILNGLLVKRSLHLLFLRFNPMRVKVSRIRRMTLINRKKIVRDCLKNALNIWNSVLIRWFTNTIFLQSSFIQI